MVGTAFKAALKAVSVMAASALIPARSSSLFLVGLATLAARCFRSSSTEYSDFGMVKLSRTSFGFFSFDAFSAVAFAMAGTGCAAVTFALSGALVRGLGAIFTAGAAAGMFFAAGAGAVLAGVLREAVRDALTGAEVLTVDALVAGDAVANSGLALAAAAGVSGLGWTLTLAVLGRSVDVILAP